MSIDMENGYTASWRMVAVEKKSWGNDEQVVALDQVTFNTSCKDKVPMLQTGSVTLTREIGEEFPPGWYRIQMLAVDSDGSARRIDVATLLFEKTSGNINYSIDQCKANGFSVLKPVNEAKMLTGEWLPKGEDGAAWCGRVLAEHTPAPVEVECSFEVNDYYVWDGGTSYLKAVWQVLDAAEKVIKIDGRGIIHIIKKPEEPTMEINAMNSPLLIPGLDYDRDYSDIPNVYYAIEGSDYAIATNDDPDSPVSTVTRGWEKTEYDDNVLRVDGETLEDYAQRKLEEKSTVVKTWGYAREYFDLVCPFEIIRFHYPKLVHSDLRVLSQTYACDKGITLNEELGEEVKLWQRS